MNKKQLTISLIGIASTCFFVGIETRKVLADEILTETSSNIERQETLSDRDFLYSNKTLNLQNNPEYLYLANIKIQEFGCDSLDVSDRVAFCGSDRPDLLSQQTEPSSQQQTESTPPEKPVSSDKSKTGWGIVADASTLGLGGAIVAGLSPNLNARVGVNGFTTDVDVDRTEVDYKGDLNLFNVSTVLDYYFGNSGFRFSLGAVFTDNKVEGIGRPFEGGIEIGNRVFSSDELGSIDADISFSSDVAPYVGLGWGNPARGNGGLGFWFNAGVLFAGTPQVTLTPNYGVAAQSSEILRNEVNGALDRERNDLQNKLDDFKVYPVVSLGLTYSF
jgi:hypothetical protein